MKKYFLTPILFLCCMTLSFAQQQDTTKDYKKRVLEKMEIDFLISYYSQDGDNAAVTGGFGTEELTDVTPTIVVSMPMNEDDVLTIDLGVSAYTSASKVILTLLTVKDLLTLFRHLLVIHKVIFG